MAALGVGIHKDWSRCIFQHFSTRLLAGIGQSLFGIVDDEFLAKGIDKTLGTARDDELIRIGGGETYGVANHVSPQPTRCGNQHGVVLVLFHAPKRNDFVLSGFAGEFLKLIEHPIVQHQQHGLVRRIVLDAKETLAGIVRLHIVHVGRGDELLVLLAVGRKRHSTVEEHLKVRPYLLQMCLTRYLHHTV